MAVTRDEPQSGAPSPWAQWVLRHLPAPHPLVLGVGLVGVTQHHLLPQPRMHGTGGRELAPGQVSPALPLGLYPNVWPHLHALLHP